MERRGRQGLDRNQNSSSGPGATTKESTPRKQVNGWMRIGSRASDETVRFNNLLTMYAEKLYA